MFYYLIEKHMHILGSQHPFSQFLFHANLISFKCKGP